MNDTTASKNSGRVLLPSEVEPSFYRLTITPNLSDDFVFTGHVEIDVTLTSSSLSSITLHSKELTLRTCIFLTKGKGHFTSSDIQYDAKATTVTIFFPKQLPLGEGTLSIDYTGIHNNQMSGFYRSEYIDSKGDKKLMVSTQFEPLDARRCLPCIDEPCRKAKFECSLIIDSQLTCLSNMPIKDKTSIEKNKIKYDFEVTPKMSTYLLAFCVGEFDFVESKTKHNVLLRVYTPPNKKHLGEFALEVGVKSLDLYDDLFGVPFPLPKMDMIAIPEFAMGAMENWGLVTYREVDILIDEIRASSQQKQRVATVVAHELAHQWFGNLVTMAWWDDLWLNEGFASWMQNYCTDYIYPEWQLWDQFIVEQQAAALSLDSLTTSHPIQVPIKHAEEVEEVFDAISYRKGASVVRLVYAYLGHDNFVNGLQLYMKTHQYGNTETYNLWKAWETVSSLPVSEVMASWTEQMGYPVLEVRSYEYKSKETILKVKQRWFLADGSEPEEGKNKLWSVPMFINTESKGIEQLDMLSTKEKEYKIKGEKLSFLKLNGGQFVPMRVKYTKEMYFEIIEGIRNKKIKSAADRAGLILDTYSLCKSGDIDGEILLNMISAYEQETEYTVWEALSTVIIGVQNILLEDILLKKQYDTFISNIILPLFYTHITWDNKNTDGHLGKLLRALFISLISSFCISDKKVVEYCRNIFNIYISEFNSEKGAMTLPAEYRTAVFKIILTNQQSDEYTKLFNIIDKLDSTVEKKHIYLSLGYVSDPKLKLETLKYSSSGQVKLQDFFYVIASVSSSGIEGLNLSWEYFKENYEMFDKMLKTASPSLMAATIVYSASGFTTEEKAKEIELFFKDKETKVGRRIAQLVEGTKNNAGFRTRVIESEGFTNFLAKF